MTKKKPNRTPSPAKSNQSGKPGKPESRDSQSGGSQSEDNADSRQFLEPDPPKPRPVLWVTSGILMVAWMIFLLFVALSR